MRQDSLGRNRSACSCRAAAWCAAGDVLVGPRTDSLIRVAAAAQPVLWCATAASTVSPFDVLRAAYHLGNRPRAAGTAGPIT